MLKRPELPDALGASFFKGKIWSEGCRVCDSLLLSEVIDISPGNLDPSLCFFQSSISHDVLCIEVK